MSIQKKTMRDNKNRGYNQDHLEDQFNGDLEGLWSNIEQDYRKQYPNITEEDITYRTGEFDGMTQKIARRTNRSRDQVVDEIKNWKS